MNDLKELETILDTMVSKQKEKKAKTFVVRYKGKNLIMSSGKSSWKQINHAKSAVLCHFNHLETKYIFEKTETYTDSYGTVRQNYNYDRTNIKKRQEEFRTKLFELIEIVELTE